MRLCALAVLLLLGLPLSLAAQPIQGNPQKAFYASPSEWPKPVSADCWWKAPGSGGIPNEYSHIGHMAITLPVGARTAGELITARFSMTTFNAAGRITRIFGRRVMSWTLDNGLTLPQPTNPTGVKTWTGTVVFDTLQSPLHGWYPVELSYRTDLDNGDFTYTTARHSFYSVRDTTAKLSGIPNVTSTGCQVSNPSQNWGQHSTEFQQVLPLLGPISPELPWTLLAACYNYTGAGLAENGRCEVRLDPDFHNGNPGTLLAQKAGGNAALPFTLPTNIPDGPYRLLVQWYRPTLDGLRDLVSNVGFDIVVGPGGVPQPPGAPPPPSGGGHTTPPPTTSPSHGTPTPTPHKE